MCRQLKYRLGLVQKSIETLKKFKFFKRITTPSQFGIRWKNVMSKNFHVKCLKHFESFTAPSWIFLKFTNRCCSTWLHLYVLWAVGYIFQGFIGLARSDWDSSRRLICKPASYGPAATAAVRRRAAAGCNSLIFPKRSSFCRPFFSVRVLKRTKGRCL